MLRCSDFVNLWESRVGLPTPPLEHVGLLPMQVHRCPLAESALQTEVKSLKISQGFLSVIFGEPCLLFKKATEEFSGNLITLCLQHQTRFSGILIVRYFSPSVGSGLHKTKKE